MQSDAQLNDEFVVQHIILVLKVLEHPNVPLGVDVVDELDIHDEGVTVEIVDPRRRVGELTEPAEGIYVKDEDPAVDQMRRDSLEQ